MVVEILKPGNLRDAVIDGLLQDLHQQCTRLCQKKDFCSVLQGLKPQELAVFTFDKLVHKWRSVAPLLLQFLATVANVSLQEKLIITPETLSGVCMAGAVLRQKNVHMSALHHIVGLILFHGNISKLVCSVTKCNKCVSLSEIRLGTLAAEPLTVVCVPGFNTDH